MEIRVHGVLPQSRVNGPGLRALVHLQGCTLGCPGCFNPGTHSPHGGEAVPVDALVARLLVEPVDGVTISGGEPFQQAEPLLELLRGLRARGVDSILVFTGYRLEELAAVPGAEAALGHIDVLVAGRYDTARAVPGATLLASDNQRLHFLTDAHGPHDVAEVGADVEITIRPDGGVTMTGFPDPSLRRAVRRLG